MAVILATNHQTSYTAFIKVREQGWVAQLVVDVLPSRHKTQPGDCRGRRGPSG
jgi:hypothetical protein